MYISVYVCVCVCVCTRARVCVCVCSIMYADITWIQLFRYCFCRTGKWQIQYIVQKTQSYIYVFLFIYFFKLWYFLHF